MTDFEEKRRWRGNDMAGLRASGPAKFMVLAKYFQFYWNHSSKPLGVDHGEYLRRLAIDRIGYPVGRRPRILVCWGFYQSPSIGRSFVPGSHRLLLP